jgi:hypothetical protein
LGIETDARADTVNNPGFERPIMPLEDAPFSWQLARSDSKFDITVDGNTRHTGNRSLRTAFRNYSKPEFANTFQIIAVAPNTNYRLTFWVLTENLKTAGPPLLQVINGNDDKLLVASAPFSVGSSDWRQYALDFHTPENCTGIRIQTSRVPCGEQCPIVGTFWYDDFEVSRSQ